MVSASSTRASLSQMPPVRMAIICGFTSDTSWTCCARRRTPNVPVSGSPKRLACRRARRSSRTTKPAQSSWARARTSASPRSKSVSRSARRGSCSGITCIQSAASSSLTPIPLGPPMRISACTAGGIVTAVRYLRRRLRVACSGCQARSCSTVSLRLWAASRTKSR